MSRFPVPALAEAFILVTLAAGLASCQQTEEDSSQAPTEAPVDAPTARADPEPSATLGPATGATAGADETSTPPPGLSPAADGYEWFETPDAWLLPARFAVQVPDGWIRAVDTTFTPDQPTSNLPYPPVPQLSVLAAVPIASPPDNHPAWAHPFIWNVGSQGGGGCMGDVSSSSATPSAQYAAGDLTWDIFSFKCAVAEPAFPPGVAYAGMAAEARVGDELFTILALHQLDAASPPAFFKQALETFTPR